MVITLSSSVGYGPTRIAAFDEALRSCGVSNYNLIRLSSIIPPGSTIKLGVRPVVTEEFGWKLYAVYAEMRTQVPGECAGSVVGWYQFPDGRGLFTEHEKIGSDEDIVRRDLEEEARSTIVSMCASRGLTIAPTEVQTLACAGTATEGKAASSLVVAAYQATPWANSTV